MRTTPLAAAAQLLAALPRPIVHLKGFGSGIVVLDQTEPRRQPPPTASAHATESAHANAELLREATSHLASMPVATLVWDGDPDRNDSFTQLIYTLKRALPPLKLVAFKYASEEDEFRTSWAAASLPDVMIITLPDDGGCAEWTPAVSAELGIQALKATGATQVFSLGGGDTVKLEFERSRVELEPPPVFTLVPVVRLSHGSIKQSALVGMPGVTEFNPLIKVSEVTT